MRKRNENLVTKITYIYIYIYVNDEIYILYRQYKIYMFVFVLAKKNFWFEQSKKVAGRPKERENSNDDWVIC